MGKEAGEPEFGGEEEADEGVCLPNLCLIQSAEMEQPAFSFTERREWLGVDVAEGREEEATELLTVTLLAGEGTEASTEVVGTVAKEGEEMRLAGGGLETPPLAASITGTGAGGS